MEVYVKAVGKDRKLKWPASHYISESKKFEVKCKILHRDLGIFSDTYKLRLKGDPERVAAFISYLKMQGFNIQHY